MLPEMVLFEILRLLGIHTVDALDLCKDLRLMSRRSKRWIVFPVTRLSLCSSGYLIATVMKESLAWLAKALQFDMRRTLRGTEIPYQRQGPAGKSSRPDADVECFLPSAWFHLSLCPSSLFPARCYPRCRAWL